MTLSIENTKKINADMRWLSDYYKKNKPEFDEIFKNLTLQFESNNIKARFPDLSVTESNIARFHISFGGHHAIISSKILIIDNNMRAQIDLHEINIIGNAITLIESVHISENGSVIDLMGINTRPLYVQSDDGCEDLALHFAYKLLTRN